MAFNSLAYALFLPLVYCVCAAAGQRARTAVLLLASAGFYALLHAPYLLGVLGFVILFTWWIGRRLDACPTERARKTVFWSGVAGNALVLILFKSLPFLSPLSPFGGIWVTIGISYYVFQAISYLVDVYLEIEKAEKRLDDFALYLAFFPKLLQGPIERAGDLLPQLKTPYRFDYENMRQGLVLFAWGLFKKVVIADRLGTFVDPVFNDIPAHTGLSLLLTLYFYAFQIYCDFSGYTDMALGSARLFNIRLTQNFNSPYLATSVADFWRRWHISFSRWILDYLFKPMQMQWRNWKTGGTVLALLVTFLISGLWHGVSWGFVIWGLLHGIYLSVPILWAAFTKKKSKRSRQPKSRVATGGQIFLTFHLLVFSWIFFRANSLGDAFQILRNLGVHFLDRSQIPFSIEYLIALVGIAFIGFFDAFRGEKSFPDLVCARSKIVRWPLYYLLVMAILLFGVFGQSKFIYFQF
ncbi:MAG TPA: MBOAT family O-acyltransferase [Candidatus Sumerlaeota bacterium]|nr:MBOAT family O-acyltransferase [Candidatus Sumerlaeota bacterium]HPS01836.1 MBOAT family O-acyltransferase [Candidatus Sumerlaeota bacterium]